MLLQASLLVSDSTNEWQISNFTNQMKKASTMTAFGPFANSKVLNIHTTNAHTNESMRLMNLYACIH